MAPVGFRAMGSGIECCESLLATVMMMLLIFTLTPTRRVYSRFVLLSVRAQQSRLELNLVAAKEVWKGLAGALGQQTVGRRSGPKPHVLQEADAASA